MSTAKIKRMNMLCNPRLLSLLLCIVLSTAAAFAQSNESRLLPLPALAEQPLQLRVAHVINPRLPRMSDAQITKLLEATAQATSEHFGVRVVFAKPVEIPIAQAFASIPERFMKLAERDQYNFQSFFTMRSRLEKAYGRGLEQQGESLEDMALFAQKNGIQLNAKNFQTFGEDVANLQLNRIAQWTQLKAIDSNSVIDSKPYHQFTVWNYLGYANMPFEFIITNQIIASVEFVQPSIHSAMRGGYTNGITSFNRHTRWGTHSIWSTFAFSSNDADWIARREGEAYSPDEAARLAGLSATHEIGHQLLHLLHPFGQKGCIMDPVPLFAYRAWADKLSAKDCPIGSSRAMTPGSYSFRYLLP
jgi:hypothetical protein